MSRIYILPDRVTNRIAAGEVIERPASVIKELVENSIDAGAREIILKLRSEGRKLIQVIDDGHGMDHDDAIISIERHSTSKIKTADDLETIGTLGFRGEALASIASVSRFTLLTRTEQETAATKVEVEGGKLKNVSKDNRKPGTTITVEDLFFNTPARLKFLKSGSVEMRWIIKQLTKYAIINPELKFQMISGAKTLLDVSPVKTIFERIYQIQGAEQAKIFLPFEKEKNGLKVYGYCSHTSHHKSNRDGLFFFINKRSVDDRILSGAVYSAYKTLLPPGKYPSVFLFLETPLDYVDVNVHPTKSEVRFKSPEDIREIITEAIRKALIKSSPVLKMETGKQETGQSAEPEKRESSLPVSRFLSDGEAIDTGTKAGQYKRDESLPSHITQGEAKSSQTESSAFKKHDTSIPDDEEEFNLTSDGDSREPLHADVQNIEDITGYEPVVLGQFANSFILVELEEDLALVDQHVAHERIRYESLKKDYETQAIESQGLLIPVSLELTAPENRLMEELKPGLENIGFEIEEFGPRSWAVKSAPVLLDGIIEEPLRELLETFDEKNIKSAGTLHDDVLDEMVTILSCHGSIKKNTPLEISKQEWLIEELFKCDEPFRCPHGRPVIIRITLKEILTKFGRTPKL